MTNFLSKNFFFEYLDYQKKIHKKLGFWVVYVLLLGIFILSISFFDHLKSSSSNFSNFQTSYKSWFLLFLFGLFVSNKNLSTSTKILFYSLSLTFYLYLIFSYPTQNFDIEIFGKNIDLRLVSILLGIATVLYPIFILFPLLFIKYYKTNLSEYIGSQIGILDYTIPWELLLILIIFMSFSCFFFKCIFFFKKKNENIIKKNLDYFIIILLGIHFSNYFLSGIEKLNLEGSGYLTWLLTNKTYYISIIAQERNFFTLNFLLGSQLFNIILFILNIPINIFTLLTQLLAIMSIFFKKFSLIITLLYDISHIGIFVTSGIFFWKWILLNLGFCFSLYKLKFKEIPLFVAFIALIMIFISPKYFKIATLGWFETRASDEVIIHVKTIDDKIVSVPSNFFLDMSIAFAQDRPIKSIGYGNSGVWGGVFSKGKERNNNNNCEKFGDKYAFTKITNENYIPKLNNTLINHHNFITSKIGEKKIKNLNYNLYPHHIFSSFKNNEEFNNLTMKDIKEYIVTTRDVCYKLRWNGKIKQKVLAQKQYFFPIN